MGTRHLIQVDVDGETKVAQYGQWDGYPEGQGVEVLNFLRNKESIKKLRERLKVTRFLDFEGKDKDFVDSFNDTEARTPEQKVWFSRYMTRDLGAEILHNIIKFDDKEILLGNESSFKDDGLYCEWYYIINLDDMTLDVNGIKKFDINKLPSNKEFIKEFEEEDE